LAIGGLLRFLDFDPNPAPKTEFDFGSAEKFPLGSRIVLPEISAILIHTRQGFSALSLVCAHLGCTLENDAESFACPSHGSRFGPEGEVIHDPVTKSLPLLCIEISEDNKLTLQRINCCSKFLHAWGIKNKQSKIRNRVLILLLCAGLRSSELYSLRSGFKSSHLCWLLRFFTQVYWEKQYYFRICQKEEIPRHSFQTNWGL
jgi:cytochrome b6-f complex iron-sulfur subunit